MLLVVDIPEQDALRLLYLPLVFSNLDEISCARLPLSKQTNPNMWKRWFRLAKLEEKAINNIIEKLRREIAGLLDVKDSLKEELRIVFTWYGDLIHIGPGKKAVDKAHARTLDKNYKESLLSAASNMTYCAKCGLVPYFADTKDGIITRYRCSKGHFIRDPYRGDWQVKPPSEEAEDCSAKFDMEDVQNACRKRKRGNVKEINSLRKEEEYKSEGQENIDTAHPPEDAMTTSAECCAQRVDMYEKNKR